MANETPRLLIDRYLHDEPYAYKCSICSQQFLRPEDRNLEEGAKEIRQAFEVHVREEHPETLGA
jgi:hypothetical protein